jgi:hypothetical protein
MKNKLLIVGGDSRSSLYVKEYLRRKNIKYFFTSRNKKKKNNNIIYYDFLKCKNLIIPKNITSVLILAGIDGEKKCIKFFDDAKKISHTILPKLIYSILKKKIFVCYISSIAVYNKDSVYGNLRLLAEKKIFEKVKQKIFLSNLCIIRPSKLLNQKKTSFKKKENKKIGIIKYKSFSKYVCDVILKKKKGIFNILGDKKFLERKLNSNNNKKIIYKNNFEIRHPKKVVVIN